MKNILFYPYYLRGLQEYKKQEYNKASQSFLKFVKYNPNNAKANFKLGMSYFKQELWEEASKYIDIALEIDSSKKSWRVQQAQAKRHQGISVKKAYDEIVKELEEKILQDSENPKLYRELALNLQKQGLWWQEIEALKKAIALDDTKADWYYRLGQSLEIMNKYNEAAQNYVKAIELKDDKADDEWYYRAGYCYETQGHDGEVNLQKSKEYYEQAIAKDTKLKAKEFGIGVFHQARGYWEEAINAYEEYLKINVANSELYYRLGMSYDRCYIWNKAEENYKEALSLDLHQTYWHYRLGFVLERQEKFEESALAYEYAAKNSSKFMAYWFYRWAYVLEKLEKYEDAAIAYLNTRNAFFQDENNLRLVKYINSFSKNISHNYDELINILSQDFTISVNWYNLAKAYDKAEEYEKARDAYIKAINRENEHNAEWQYDLGLVEFKLGLYKEACVSLRDARIVQKAYGVADDALKNDGFKQSAIYTELYDSLEINPNLVLFESFHGASMSCNPYALFLYMFEKEEFKNFTYIWVVNDLEKVDEKWKRYENIIFVKRDSYLYMRYLASAKYLINNTTFHTYFIRKENQKYLNTWHGTPWKTLGKDIQNNFMEHRNPQRNFLSATHILSPNKHTTKVLIERFDIDNLYNGKLYESGYPRIDLTLNSIGEKTKLKDILNINNNKKTVLYAPTWRGTLGSPAVEIEKLIEEITILKELDINLLFRGHYFVETSIYENSLDNILVPESITSNELMSVVDVLITDYSSIAFDFMATKKPIIYYIDDYEIYKNDRGLYFDKSELPGECAFNIEELKELLKENISTDKSHKNYEKSINEFVPYEDGQVSKRVINWFIFDKEYNEIKNTKNKKKNILIYAGAFMANGITVSLINLINHIDNEKYDITISLETHLVDGHNDRLEMLSRLPSHVKLLARSGRINQTIEENWIDKKMASKRNLQSSEMWDIFKNIYQKEFSRMYGNTKFDYIINFDGYARYWAYLFAYQKNNIMYLHNDMLGEWVEKFPTQESVINIYNNYDKLISVSHSTNLDNKANLAKRFNIDENKFDYCDNLLNPAETFEKSEELLEDEEFLKIRKSASKLFINMARLSVEKGHKQLIEAFEEILKIEQNAKLVILGDGPLRLELETIIKEKRLENSIYMLGRKSNPFPYLKQSDCFVFASKHEGQGLVLLEAMMLNKPIVCTNFACAYDVLEDGKYGLLVENNSEGLFEGMKEYLKGNISQVEFDYNTYNKNALESFYKKVCN